MRLLLYGLQSSGASTFAFLLAQNPGCLAFVDVFSYYAAPELEYRGDVVAKVTITASFPLSLHQQRFRPDYTILILRDPHDNYCSLRTKQYRNHNGLIDEKFTLVEEAFVNRSEFDDVWFYEDLVLNKERQIEKIRRLGWPWSDDYLHFPRRPKDQEEAVWEAEPELFDRLQFGMGEFKPGKIFTGSVRFYREPKLSAHVEALCPSLSREYDRLRKRRWPRVTAAATRGEWADDIPKDRLWLLNQRASYLLELAQWLLKHGQTDEAERAARSALELNRDVKKARLILCRILCRQARTGEALTIAQESCDYAPDDAAAHAALATCLLLENQIAEAERFIRHALELDPTQAEHHRILSTALAGQDRFEEAIVAIKEALRLNAASPALRRELQRLRQALGA